MSNKIFISLLLSSLFAGVFSNKLCINKSVDDARNDMKKLSEKIEKAKNEKACRFVGYRWKAKEKVKCNSDWYPNVLGNMSWYPDSVSKPYQFGHAKQKTNAHVAYWFGVGPYLEWFGNFYLDFYIYETFFHQGDNVLMNGTFLETGGADGVVSSNTLFFDRFLNWNGVLIEPTVCAKVQIPFTRPRAVTFHGGVCSSETTISVANMKAFCPDDEGFKDWDAHVRCARLNTYLDESAVGKTVDFMSIDVEGYFMPVLETVPFDSYNIRVLVVECTHGEQQCRTYLESKGYNVLFAKGLIPGNVDEDVIAWKNDC